MDSILGRTILGYEVKEKIGTGGFGEVYRVERNNIVGKVTRALKVVTLPKENQYMEVLNSMGGDYEKADNYFKQELNRVVNEIRVFSMISEKDNHNIVSYYENDVEKTGKYKYNIYILMEMLTPLDKWLSENNMTVHDGINIGISIANALKICHENKIMHRDIKLNNIFVSKDGKFKLGDFGVSKRFDTLTKANTIKGTPRYIAPEIYMGNAKYNNSVDIYSLGILMYYLFNKRRFPFYPDFPVEYTAEDEDKAFYKRMQYEPAKVPMCAPNEVSKIILKTIAPPKERYSDVEELISDFKYADKVLSLEEKEQKIGFEPVIPKTPAVYSNKEKQLLKNLESSYAESISFGEHSVETVSRNRVLSSKRRSIVIVASIVLITAVMFLGGYEIISTRNAKSVKTGLENTLTTNPSTLQVGTITDYKQKIKIQNYKNKQYLKIKELLTNEGLRVKKQLKYNSKVKKGYIISQSISAKTDVNTGTEILFIVSKGEKDVEPPSTTPYVKPQPDMGNVTRSVNRTQPNNDTKSDKKNNFDFKEIVE